jgi:hypothetical protein
LAEYIFLSERSLDNVCNRMLYKAMPPASVKIKGGIDVRKRGCGSV